MLSPGKANVGIIPASFFKEGNVGVVSRSGTLTYQIGNELAQRGFGNSSIVGIGGDPVPGTSFIDVLALFEADPETELIVMCGEIGGDAEEERGRLHRRARHQAGRRLHRRLHRAARQDDGPRGRDRLRLRRAPPPAKAEALEAQGRAGRPHADRGRANWRPVSLPNSFGRQIVNRGLALALTSGPWHRSPSRAARRRATSSTSTACARPPRLAFEEDPAGTTAYGTAVGYVPLREWIAEKHGVDV